MRHRLVAMAVASLLTSFAQAAPFSWINWTSFSGSTASGVISTSNGNTNVTLTGPFTSVYSSYPSWTPLTTWKDGSVIDNAPYEGQTTAEHQIVRIDNSGSFNLSFDIPVDHLAFAVWSVGGGNTVTYTFDQDLSLISGGPSAEYGGGSITVGSNWLQGHEGNGTVMFDGPFNSLSWTIDNPESWHGFSIGLATQQSVPEPTTMAALAAGAALLARRRRHR